MRLWLVVWLALGGWVWAQPPRTLHLRVTTPSQPAVRFDAQGRARPETLGEAVPPVSLEAVAGRPLPYQSIERSIPWWYGPEIPLGPGRAWPSWYPAYGSPFGPAWPGPYW